MRRAKQAPNRLLLDLMKAWLTIGTQSVGGGPSTLYLMRRELVERRGWLSHREFLEDWALSKLSLGINQIALTGLEGLRVAGLRGLVVALAALLLPAGAITALVTAGYDVVRGEPAVKAALAGAGPVIAGMTIALAYTFAQGSVRRTWRGWVDRAYWAAVTAVALLGLAPPIVVIAAGVVVGLAFLRGEPSRASADPGT
jgi:chromate transporter